MGNQSKPKENNNSAQTKFLTYAGVEVDSNGHSEEWMDTLNNKIFDWIRDGEGSPSSDMDEDEIEYILINKSNVNRKYERHDRK